jgi:hypothetical protein
MVVDVTVTCACINSNVPVVETPHLFIRSLTLGAQQGKLDANIRTSSSLDEDGVDMARCPFRLNA